MNTFIYRFHARPPTENGDLARNLLLRGHRYGNALIAIERECRGRYREIERSIVPVTVADAVEVAEAAEERAALAIRAARSAFADVEVPDATTLERALAEARAVIKAARAAYKEASGPLRDAALLVGAAREVEKAEREAAEERDRDDVRIGDLLRTPALLAPVWVQLPRQNGRRVSVRLGRGRKTPAAEKAQAKLDSTTALLQGAPGAIWDLAVRLHESDTAAAAATRAARAESKLPWGVYTLVEEAVERAAKETAGDPHAPRFRRGAGETDSTGRILLAEEGRIGAPQFPGGLHVADAFAGTTRFRLEVLPLPERVRDTRVSMSGEPVYREPGNWTSKRRHAIVRIRAGSTESKDPRWIAWPILYDRPFPEDAVIRRAWAICRIVAGKEQWEIHVTLALPDPAARAIPSEGPRVVSIDVGWRATAGYRVGYLVDLQGRSEAVTAPLVSRAAARHRRAWADRSGSMKYPGMDSAPAALVRAGWKQTIPDALAHADVVRGFRDDHFNVARGFLRVYLDGIDVLPVWLAERVQYLAQWRDPRKLARLLRQWEAAAPDDRITGGEAILGGLRAWSVRNHHLWEMEAHGRQHVFDLRREHYRVLAARIARDYDVVIVPKIDLRDFAVGPAPEEGPASKDRPLRKAQRACAPSEWIGAVLQAARREGCQVVELPPADLHEGARGDSRTCHVCGSVETLGADLIHACAGCGSVWDRDPNACTNRLRRAGYDPTRALRCAVSLEDRSQARSPTKTPANAVGEGSGTGAAFGSARKTVRKHLV